MTVSFLDVGWTYRQLKPQVDAAVARVLSSGWYILGPEVEAFEQEYARWLGVDHCIGVANGLDAIVLGLMAVGIREGDEVLVPANTFIATWLAVSQLGAHPIPVDVDSTTMNLSLASAQRARTKKTRAVIPVHLYGRACALEPLLSWARSEGLQVVDDAAQAHGATSGGRRIGGHCAATSWSFYPTKNLGAFGDAGAITTNDAELARKLRMLRNYGSEKKYHHQLRGVNSRLDPIQAAILRCKLPLLESWNDRRKAQAQRYLEGLAGAGLELPENDPGSCWYAFVLRSARRDSLQQFLTARGVETLIHYPVVPHAQPAYAELGLAPGTAPVAERLQKEVLSLPIGPHLEDAQIDEVIAALRMFQST